MRKFYRKYKTWIWIAAGTVAIAAVGAFGVFGRKWFTGGAGNTGPNPLPGSGANSAGTSAPIPTPGAIDLAPELGGSGPSWDVNQPEDYGIDGGYAGDRSWEDHEGQWGSGISAAEAAPVVTPDANKGATHVWGGTDFTGTSNDTGLVWA